MLRKIKCLSMATSKLYLSVFNVKPTFYCAMSNFRPPQSATDHPELVSIGLEVTLDPSRRRHYSDLVLTLADAAMQELIKKIIAAKAGSPRER